MAGIQIKNDMEWEGVLEALAQYVENEQCCDAYDDPHAENPKLAGAEAVLERMELAILRALGVE